MARVDAKEIHDIKQHYQYLSKEKSTLVQCQIPTISEFDK
jgi:hypothetical protein